MWIIEVARTHLSQRGIQIFSCKMMSYEEKKYMDTKEFNVKEQTRGKTVSCDHMRRSESGTKIFH